MQNDNFPRESRTGSVLAGLFLLVVGVFAVIQQTVSDFPSWIFSWPMILITVGIFIGLKHGFRGPGWIILIGLGSVFLVDRVVPGVNLKPYIWPMVVITIGLIMIFGGGRKRGMCRYGRRRPFETGPAATSTDAEAGTSGPARMSDPFDTACEDELVNSTAILGSSKKVIFSKNFKGGEITNFMGGAEIDCSQADINGVVKLDITQIFGGTKLIVPRHWMVKSTATSIFGGFEDKRRAANIQPDNNKVLVIEGTSIFGGIEIKSF